MVLVVVIGPLKSECGVFHLVVTEVVSVGGDVDEKVEFISIKIASVCIDSDLSENFFLGGGGGVCPWRPRFQTFSLKSISMPVTLKLVLLYFIGLCRLLLSS